MGVVQNLYGTTKLRVIAINSWETVATIKPYARGNAALFLRDGSGGTWNTYAQNGYTPLNYVIRPNGKVYNWMEGYNETTIKNWITAVAVEEENAAKVKTPELVFSTNPFKVNTVISVKGIDGVGTLQIHDLTGRLVKSFSITSNSAVTWDRKGAPAGMYFCKLNAGKVNLTKKLIVLE